MNGSFFYDLVQAQELTVEGQFLAGGTKVSSQTKEGKWYGTGLISMGQFSVGVLSIT